jgi:hypothetical protein
VPSVSFWELRRFEVRFCQLGLEKRDKVTVHTVAVTGLSIGDEEASRCVMTLLQSCTLTRATRRDGNSLVRFAAASAGHEIKI